MKAFKTGDCDDFGPCEPQSRQAAQQAEPQRAGPFSRRFWRRAKNEDEPEFVLLEDARVPIALPRGRKLVAAQRPPRGRW